MIDREQIEREVAALIRGHAAIGYSFKDGEIDGRSLFIAAEGAAHVVVHHLLATEREPK